MIHFLLCTFKIIIKIIFLNGLFASLHEFIRKIHIKVTSNWRIPTFSLYYYLARFPIFLLSAQELISNFIFSYPQPFLTIFFRWTFETIFYRFYVQIHSLLFSCSTTFSADNSKFKSSPRYYVLIVAIYSFSLIQVIRLHHPGFLNDSFKNFLIHFNALNNIHLLEIFYSPPVFDSAYLKLNQKSKV